MSRKSFTVTYVCRRQVLRTLRRADTLGWGGLSIGGSENATTLNRKRAPKNRSRSTVDKAVQYPYHYYRQLRYSTIGNTSEPSVSIGIALMYIRGWFQKRKPIEFISLLAVVIAVADMFFADVTWVTVALLGIAIVPWTFSLEHIHKYIESFELPGGTKVALRKASEEAQGIELEESPDDSDVAAFIEVIRENPNLTLVGLRIELERRLRMLARRYGLSQDKQYTSVRKIQNLLFDKGALKPEEVALLNDLWPTLNRAAHAEHIDIEAQNWAIQAADPLIRNLDARIDKINRPEFLD
jgi:hypothetical protein